MKPRWIAIVAGTCLTLAAGYTQTANKPSREAEVKALKDLEVQWNRDFAAKDVDKLAAHYTDDASVMASGIDPFVGKDAIRSMMKEMAADPGLSLKFHATRVEISKSGDMGFTQGSYTMTMTDPHSKSVVNDKGSYVTVYRKQPDGSWKAVSDIASSAVPPMGTT